MFSLAVLLISFQYWCKYFIQPKTCLTRKLDVFSAMILRLEMPMLDLDLAGVIKDGDNFVLNGIGHNGPDIMNDGRL